MPTAYLSFLLLFVLSIGSCTIHTKNKNSDSLVTVSGQRENSNISHTGSVSLYKSKPTIHIDNIPTSPIIYALPDVPGGRWSWDEIPQHNIKQFCEQGVKMYQVDLFLEYMWKENGDFDMTIAKKLINGVLEVCPDATVFFRFHLNAPKWWVDQYPEENVIYDGVEASPDQNIGLSRILEADPRNPVRSSMASKKWKAISSEKLVHFCKEFSKTEEGNSLIGIQVAYGVYGEWHQWGINENEADFSKPMQEYFKKWLTDKYGNDKGLQDAWNNQSLLISDIKVPTEKERNIISGGIFRDPKKDMKVIDYYSCQHELVADNIIHFSKIVKEN